MLIGARPTQILGNAIGIPSLQIEEDLKRFRDFIEEQGRETGGWRGEIILGQTSHQLPATETAARESVPSASESADRSINSSLAADLIQPTPPPSPE